MYLDAERLSWATDDYAGAFGSPLKLPSGGYRYSNLGELSYVGSTGFYWGSTVQGSYAMGLSFGSSESSVLKHPRAHGFSVRCIKD